MQRDATAWRRCSLRPPPPDAPCHPLPRRSFFEDYKKNENKEVQVEEFYGAEASKKVVLDSLRMYQEHYVPKKSRIEY